MDAAIGGAECGWEFVQDSKGVIIHRKTFDKTQYCLRGMQIIPLSIDEVGGFVCFFLKKNFVDEEYMLEFEVENNV
jgi:hypothetical protein